MLSIQQQLNLVNDKERLVKALNRTLELVSDPEVWIKNDYFIQSYTYVVDGIEHKRNLDYPQDLHDFINEFKSEVEIGKCQVCLLGAWRLACYEDNYEPLNNTDAVLGIIMRECMKKVSGRDFSSVVSFNDALERTQEEVIEAVKCSIEQETNRQPPQQFIVPVAVRVYANSAEDATDAVKRVIYVGDEAVTVIGNAVAVPPATNDGGKPEVTN